MIYPDDIVAEAREWIGTPWQHQQRLKGVATDCIGLVGGVALELGIEGAKEWSEDPDLHHYGPTPDPHLLLAGCDRFLDRIEIDDALPGDVLIMAFRRDPQHFAIVSRLDPIYLIHAYSSVGRVVENGVKIARARILRAYKYRGVV